MKFGSIAPLVVVIFAAGTLRAAEPKERPPKAPPTPEQVALIDAAVPTRAPAQPLAPRRLLIFTRTEGYVHGSIPFGVEAIRHMGDVTGAYRSTVSDDMSVFAPDQLKQFDAIVLLSTTRLEFADPSERQALLDFVRNGKGLVGIHAATDNFYSWPEAQAMLGGRFHEHPWGAGVKEAVKNDDPASPVNAAFGGKGFWVRDEIYEIVGPYGRDQEHVLLSLDMSKPENLRDAVKSKIGRTDNDFPISWIKTFGQGRVFYCSLGHRDEIFWCTPILQHYLAGIQYALGDLSADATPSTSLNPPPAPALAPDDPSTPALDPPPPPTLSPAVTAALDRFGGYQYGASRSDIDAIEAYLREGPAGYALVEDRLLALLQKPDLPDGARDQSLRLLKLCGSAKAVPALASLLTDPRWSLLAATALMQLPGPAAEQALTDALDEISQPAQDAVISAVGRRRITGAVPKLATLAASQSVETADAALVALGAIGSAEASQALESAKVAPASGIVLLRARLDAAHRLWRESPDAAAKPEATAVFLEIASEENPAAIRLDALRGLIAADHSSALPIFRAALSADDARFSLGAANLADQFPPGTVLAGWGDGWTHLPAPVQCVLLRALARNPGPEIRAALGQALGSPDPTVQWAAIHGLGAAGDVQSVSLLVPFLDGGGDLGDGAIAALGRLADPAAGSVLRDALGAAQGPRKAALVRIEGARFDRAAFDSVLGACSDPEPAVRAAAYQAIGALAGPDDLERILALHPAGGNERRLFYESVIAAARDTESHRAVDVLNAALGAPGTDADARSHLLVVLAMIGSPESLAILQQRLSGPDPGDRRQVIRALAGSANPQAMPLLLQAARNAADPTEKILALRGYLALLTMPSTRTNASALAAYQAALPLADQPQDQAAIQAAIARIRAAARR